MPIDAPTAANFNEDEDDQWLYGETNANSENSQNLTGALAESKIDDSEYDESGEFLMTNGSDKKSNSNGIKNHFSYSGKEDGYLNDNNNTPPASNFDGVDEEGMTSVPTPGNGPADADPISDNNIQNQEKISDEINNNEKNNDSDEDDDDDEDDEDDDKVNIVIDTTKYPQVNQANASLLARQTSKITTNQVATTVTAAQAAAAAAIKATQAKGVDLEAPGLINDAPTYDYDLEEVKDEDKPWRKPGADITDYFNYGFNEETWIAYCMKQKRLRAENANFKANIQMVHQQNSSLISINSQNNNQQINQNSNTMTASSSIIGAGGQINAVSNITSNNNSIQVSTFNNGSAPNPHLQNINPQNMQQPPPHHMMHQGGQIGFQNKMQFQPRFPPQQHQLQPYQGHNIQQLPPHMQQQQQQRKMGLYTDMPENQPHSIPGQNFVAPHGPMPDFSAPPPNFPGGAPVQPPSASQPPPNMMPRLQLPPTRLPPPSVHGLPPQIIQQQQPPLIPVTSQAPPFGSSNYQYPPVSTVPPPGDRSQFGFHQPFRGPGGPGQMPQQMMQPNMGPTWEKPPTVDLQQQPYFSTTGSPHRRNMSRSNSRSQSPRSRHSKSPGILQQPHQQQQLGQNPHGDNYSNKYSKDSDLGRTTSYKHGSRDYSSRDHRHSPSRHRDYDRRGGDYDRRGGGHRDRSRDRDRERDRDRDRDRSKDRSRDKDRSRSRSRDDKYKRSRRKSDDDDYRSSSKSHKRSKKSSRKDRDSMEKDRDRDRDRDRETSSKIPDSNSLPNSSSQNETEIKQEVKQE